LLKKNKKTGLYRLDEGRPLYQFNWVLRLIDIIKTILRPQGKVKPKERKIPAGFD